MSVIGRSEKEGTALDVLQAEDLELRQLFAALGAARGTSVEERARYGDSAKEIIRHLAIREAALVDVAKVAGDDPNLQALASRIDQNIRQHRRIIDRVEKMSRGVQGINLRAGQDFDGSMDELTQLVGTEIVWELEVALPEVQGALRATRREDELKSAGHISAHAPTNLSPEGPRWWEQAPLISRLITVYDRLRDFPRARHRP